MSRRDARVAALEVLYEADARDEDALDVMARKGEGDPYARRLIEGVVAHSADIDAVISSHSRGWEITHMPVIDRNALRLALYELIWGGIPAAVVMDEAVELCKQYSSDEAGRFVNGILAAVAAEQAQAPR